MESDEEDAEQDFADTVKENENLSEAYDKYQSPEHFLQRSEKLYARSISLSVAAASVWLQFKSDIDGCVVELNNLAGIRFPVRHLSFCPRDLFSVREIKGFLKKHIDLKVYSKTDLRNFNNCVGFQLFYERGWECWIALIPRVTKNSAELKKDVIKQTSFNFFKELRCRFGKELASYARNGTAHRTLMKNDLNDLGKVFVLPDDCSVILRAVDSALTSMVVGVLRPIVFCFRFGEKMINGLPMTDFQTDCIESVTVHSAVNISCQCEDISLLWSMSGLQEMVGDRGTLSTCLSFTDCCNYQSNLDGREIDIKSALRCICREPRNLRFIQLYADLPHLKPSTRFHPVSGYIAGGLCFPQPTAEAFGRDAARYLSTLENNWLLMRRSECRLEIVVEVQPCDVLYATDCLNMTNLSNFLEEPMLVPISSRTLSSIRKLGLWIHEQLRSLCENYQRTANVSATWQAFQLELASEKLLWGRPFCYQSNLYSVNLGPGVLGASRSVTDQMGFLSLEPFTTCMSAENTLPPFRLWTSSAAVGDRITRSAGLHDVLQGSFCVIGRHLMNALLRDLYMLGKADRCVTYADFLANLKASNSTFSFVGAITRSSLVQMLVTKRRIGPQMVFGVLCQLIERSGVPLQHVIESGIEELQLTCFPAVETYDQHGHAILNWSFRRNFWRIVIDVEKPGDNIQSPEVYSDLVKGELERRGLIYAGKLKKVPGKLPWIESCLRKLEREGLSQVSTVTTLCFISCLAFMMQGWFVEFDRLAKLLMDIPTSQSKLKALEIQSKLEMPRFKFKQLTLYRLHQTIPHQLPPTDSTTRMSAQEHVDEPEATNEYAEDCNTRKVPDDDILGNDHVIEKRFTICQPVVLVTHKTWTGRELEILHVVASARGSKTLKELYLEFKEKCMREQIPFRTFRSFENKLRRL